MKLRKRCVCARAVRRVCSVSVVCARGGGGGWDGGGCICMCVLMSVCMCVHMCVHVCMHNACMCPLIPWLQ